MHRLTNLKRFYYQLCLALPPRKPLAVLAAAGGYVRARLFRKPVLRGVDIVTNYSCNLACRHCNIHTMRRRDVPTLSLDDYRDIERQCSEMGVFQYTFTGGDPLLRKDLERLVSTPFDGASLARR